MQVHQLSRACGDSPHEAEIRVVSQRRNLNLPVERAELLPGVLALHVGAMTPAPQDDAPANEATPPRDEGGAHIEIHKTNAVNKAIDVQVMDEPGPGGASHLYRLTVWRDGNPIDTELRFQKGPLGVTGPNGITNEAILAVAIDRLESFQRGPFACKDNEDALGLIKAGLTCLKKRTAKRVEQGVEGTNVQHAEPPTPQDPPADESEPKPANG